MNKQWTFEDIIIVLKDLDKKYGTNIIDETNIRIDGKASKTLGKYEYTKEQNGNGVLPQTVTFAPNLLDGRYSEEAVNHCIKHEYIHYLIEDDFNNPKGHNSEFKEKCRELNISEEEIFPYKEIVKNDENEFADRIRDEIDGYKRELKNTAQYLTNGMANPEYTRLKGRIESLEWVLQIEKNYR